MHVPYSCGLCAVVVALENESLITNSWWKPHWISLQGSSHFFRCVAVKRTSGNGTGFTSSFPKRVKIFHSGRLYLWLERYGVPLKLGTLLKMLIFFYTEKSSAGKGFGLEIPGNV